MLTTVDDPPCAVPVKTGALAVEIVVWSGTVELAGVTAYTITPGLSVWPLAFVVIVGAVFVPDGV